MHGDRYRHRLGYLNDKVAIYLANRGTRTPNPIVRCGLDIPAAECGVIVTYASDFIVAVRRTMPKNDPLGTRVEAAVVSAFAGFWPNGRHYQNDPSAIFEHPSAQIYTDEIFEKYTYVEVDQWGESPDRKAVYRSQI